MHTMVHKAKEPLVSSDQLLLHKTLKCIFYVLKGNSLTALNKLFCWRNRLVSFDFQKINYLSVISSCANSRWRHLTSSIMLSSRLIGRKTVTGFRWKLKIDTFFSDKPTVKNWWLKGRSNRKFMHGQKLGEQFL